MTPLQIQRLLACVFLGLGGWALFLPGQVLSIGIRSDLNSGDVVSTVLMGCFGAQAVLGGTVMLLSRFTQRTFLVFGILGSLPFFVFNYYFVFIVPVFSSWMLLDFAGNIAILTLCIMGYLGMKKTGQQTT
ncbi:MAG: hypothetical protein AAGA72_03000 [Pseudomonadota bacterium]